MVERIVATLDTNQDGYMSRDESKVLISKLSGIPVLALSDEVSAPLR